MRALRALCLIAAATPSGAAAEFVLGWPVDCLLGKTCHIQNYVDHDPGPGWRDFTCNALSYDGHKGTDIALPTRDRIAEGIAVRAAAPGRVQGVRDEMPDQLYTGQDLAGRDCGNGVVIDHGDGWVTQYCHLRRGSISVGPGAEVREGDKIGEIGLSGRSEFAHLHLSLRKDGAVIDPFAPNGAESCPPPDTASLWRDDVAYVAGGLLDIGFATAVPDYDAVKAGSAATTPSDTAPLVLFGYGYGMRAGDRMALTITGPDGIVFSNEERFDRPRAQAFRAGGRRAPPGGWPPGRYRGEVGLHRDGAILSRRTIETEMP